MTTTKLKNKKLTNLPTILSFTRKIEPSDGLMYSGKWENIINTDDNLNELSTSFSLDVNELKRNLSHSMLEKISNLSSSELHKIKQLKDLSINKLKNKVTSDNWKKIILSNRQNLGTQSHYSASEKERKTGNPVEGDKASLFDNDDTLKLSFMLKILGKVGEPSACNDPAFEQLLLDRYNWIKNNDGLKKLAYRYAYNIANARFLFRNRVNSEEIKVFVKKDADIIEFNAFDFSRLDFEKNHDNKQLKILTDWIFEGLNSDEDANFILLEITSYAKMGNRSQVYPSQEMNTGEKRKTLFKLEDCAGMHDVKLSNAIRTIDNWHQYKDSNNELVTTPFAIEPFGAVVQKGIATRDKNKKDLYGYLKSLPIYQNEGKVDDQDLFFVANLIRGGLFQGKAKD